MIEDSGKNGNLMIRELFHKGNDSIHDIRVVDTGTSSYEHRNTGKSLLGKYRIKKKIIWKPDCIINVTFTFSYSRWMTFLGTKKMPHWSTRRAVSQQSGDIPTLGRVVISISVWPLTWCRWFDDESMDLKYMWSSSVSITYNVRMRTYFTCSGETKIQNLKLAREK